MAGLNNSEAQDVVNFAHDINNQAGFQNDPTSNSSTGLISIGVDQLTSGGSPTLESDSKLSV